MPAHPATSGGSRRHLNHKQRMKRDSVAIAIDKRDTPAAPQGDIAGLAAPSGNPDNQGRQDASVPPSVPSSPPQPSNDLNAVPLSSNNPPPPPAASSVPPQVVASSSSPAPVYTSQGAVPVPIQSSQSQPSQSPQMSGPSSAASAAASPSSQQSQQSPEPASNPAQSPPLTQQYQSASPSVQQSQYSQPSSAVAQTSSGQNSVVVFSSTEIVAASPVLSALSSSQLPVTSGSSSTSSGQTGKASVTYTQAILANANGASADIASASSATVTPPVFADSSNSDDKPNLAAGGVAGIVVALLVIGVCIVGVVMKRRKQRNIGGTREMSSYYNGVPSLILPIQGGSSNFTSFRDNASTRTSTLAASTPMQSSLSLYPGAPPLRTAPSSPVETDDDSSIYGDDSFDGHNSSTAGNQSHQNQSYYTAHPAPYSSRSLATGIKMPEYALPSPPIPALDPEETSYTKQQQQSSSLLHTTPTDLERSRSQRSIASQRSYVDEQLVDLYVGQY